MLRSSRWTCLSFILIFLAMSPLLAQDAPPPSIVDGITSPPVFGTVGQVQVADGQLLLEQTEVRQVPVSEERVVVENGVEKRYTVTKFVYETVVLQKRFSLVKGRVFTADEKPVPDKKLAELLKKGLVVLIATDQSGNISKQYLKVLKPDTVVLVGKLD